MMSSPSLSLFRLRFLPRLLPFAAPFLWRELLAAGFLGLAAGIAGDVDLAAEAGCGWTGIGNSVNVGLAPTGGVSVGF